MGLIHWMPVEGPEVTEDASEQPEYERLREYVGGWIEYVSVLYKGKRTTMVVNEEGRLNDLPINERATEIYYAAAASQGVDLADKDQREAHSDALWRDRGVDPSQVLHLDPQPDKPPAIHGPAIVLEDIRPE